MTEKTIPEFDEEAHNRRLHEIAIQLNKEACVLAVSKHMPNKDGADMLSLHVNSLSAIVCMLCYVAVEQAVQVVSTDSDSDESNNEYADVLTSVLFEVVTQKNLPNMSEDLLKLKKLRQENLKTAH